MGAMHFRTNETLLLVSFAHFILCRLILPLLSVFLVGGGRGGHVTVLSRLICALHKLNVTENVCMRVESSPRDFWWQKKNEQIM
jgi:hypothetical protein